MKDKGKKPMVMIHTGQINKNTTICIHTEEKWRQDTAEDNDIRYINNILSGTEETSIDTK